MNHYPDGSLPYLNAYESAIAASEWLDDRVNEIEQQYQAELPALMAEAKETLDEDELAEMTDADYRTWFYESKFNFRRKNEALETWFH